MTTRIVIARWMDTTSNKSRENGDYESTGDDWQECSYSLDQITEAVADFADEYNKESWDESAPTVGQVSYSADSEQDYITGIEYHSRLLISVVSDALERDRKTVAKLQALIEEAI